MLLLELTALSIVVLYVLTHVYKNPDAGDFLIRISLISAASWVAEESCILIYGFHAYSPKWSLSIGDVPLLVVIIWPFVIHSAWELARQISSRNQKLAFVFTGAIVFTDASLIEPISVQAGLWEWNEPGIFHVPVIGILGWAYFSYLCSFFYHRFEMPARPRALKLLCLVFPVIGTHLLLLGTWWAVFRWIGSEIDPIILTLVVWSLSLLLVIFLLKDKTGVRVKKKTLLLRIPPSIFFFTLIILNSDGMTWFVLYILAFIPPYLTLMFQQYVNCFGAGNKKRSTKEKTRIFKGV
ncbi:carotenoid biosynthesis protein [Thermodesulfobacteriota bacterium]